MDRLEHVYHLLVQFAGAQSWDHVIFVRESSFIAHEIDYYLLTPFGRGETLDVI